MIIGIGNDIIEICRIKMSYEEHPGFLRKIYTEKEINYCLSSSAPEERFAGRFAAKEAVAKAFGVALSWHDVEILPGPTGRPIILLHGKAADLAGGASVHISISHCKQYASAVAIIESNEDTNID